MENELQYFTACCEVSIFRLQRIKNASQKNQHPALDKPLCTADGCADGKYKEPFLSWTNKSRTNTPWTNKSQINILWTHIS